MRDAPGRQLVRLGRAGRFVVGLSLGALPFVPIVLGHWEGFHAHVLSYRSFSGDWGITGVLRLVGLNTHFAAVCGALGTFWTERGPLILFGSGTLLAGIHLLKQQRWSAHELVATMYSAFLVLTPGWGIQYAVYPVPALSVANWKRGAVFALVGGVYVVVAYLGLWTGTYPYYSSFYEGMPEGCLLLGYFAWLVMIPTLVELLRARTPPPRASTDGPLEFVGRARA